MVKSPFSAIVLAAGKGTRMKSPLPKVLHPVAGRPMIQHVVETVKASGAHEVRVVLGHGEALVREAIEPLGAVCFRQQNQHGTADAVRAAEPENMNGVVIILNGDHPLIEVADLQKIVAEFTASSAHIGMVTVTLDDPGQYGRVIRNQGRVWGVVEAKDATHESRKIKEVNTGIYITRSEILQQYLPLIQPHNAQNEFYLTDLISLAVTDGRQVDAIPAALHVSQGVNDQRELSLTSRILFKRKIERLMSEGVVVMDPDQTYVELSVQVGEGAVLFPNVHLRGQTKLGAMVVVEPGCMIQNSEIGDGVNLKAGCYIDQAKVGAGSDVGPYAHLRPGTVIGKECKVGNFVEMKKVNFGDGSKASHLTYLGDATIGTDTNIGCGTITCNYAADRKKYETIIGNNVFVGSDTQFVAPVKIGDNAIIGSGSTITKDVPAHALAVARGKQIIKENYLPKAPGAKGDSSS